MKYNRRDFIKFSGGASIAVGAVSVLSNNVLSRTLIDRSIKNQGGALALQNADSFQKLLGSEFYLMNESAAVTAILSEVKINQTNSARNKKDAECFSLGFEMPANVFEQKTYQLFHPAIGSFELFMVPGKTENGKATLLAVINRI